MVLHALRLWDYGAVVFICDVALVLFHKVHFVTRIQICVFFRDCWFRNNHLACLSKRVAGFRLFRLVGQVLRTWRILCFLLVDLAKARYIEFISHMLLSQAKNILFFVIHLILWLRFNRWNCFNCMRFSV